MRDYNFMSPHAKKVMRLSAVLFWIPIALVLLTAFNILNWLFWEILDNYISIVSSVIIILLVAVFTLVIAQYIDISTADMHLKNTICVYETAFYFWMKK